MRKFVLRAMLAGAVLTAGASQTASATPPPTYSWTGNGYYCAGSVFTTCFSIDLSWTNNVATLTIGNAVDVGDLIKAAGLFNLGAAYPYTVGGQAGYGAPPPSDLSNYCNSPLNDCVYASTNTQGSEIPDGQSGTWTFTFTSLDGTQTNTVLSGAGVSVAGHFISATTGSCSIKPSVDASGNVIWVEALPVNPACGAGSTVPEPASMILMATGLVSLAGMGLVRRRRNKLDS